MPFQIVHNNIINMKTDAVVNAANSMLKEGGGVCGAIFAGAGAEKLQKACDALAPCPVGHAVLTEGFKLPVRYIIHAVGPIWRGGGYGERELLAKTYRNALALAWKAGCRSAAFPLISAGIYGYPRKEALETAISSFRSFLKDHEMELYLVVFDRKAVEISEKLYRNVQHYIDAYAREEERRSRAAQREFWQTYESAPASSPAYTPSAAPGAGKRTLEELLARKEETFSEMLLRLIDEKGYTDVEVYKRANMDRKLFSKIRSNRDYIPRKQNVLSLAVALRLSLDEALDLLGRAGYALSMANKMDVILKYFLETGEYDIFLINETLFAFGQATL
ncbi:MAG TPA: macro domain-containing protein [Candidatus Choladousia intestinavium]|uniref:Macro domain-containing protein n=1 Tax=Candidatus Choladousia intestinavium TaxID=2840727 RepID=A0A9D1ADS6_9FIRM|nr:macro domain-containing protein [Candidatus Choladousia intestinavium]